MGRQATGSTAIRLCLVIQASGDGLDRLECIMAEAQHKEPLLLSPHKPCALQAAARTRRLPVPD